MPEPQARGRGGVREFLVDNAVVGGAQLLMKLRGVLTLPLIVKTLGTASYGIWSQVLAFVAFGAVIVGWNLHLPLVRSIAAEREGRARAYSTIAGATIALALLAAAVAAPFTGLLGRLLLGQPDLDAYLSRRLDGDI